MPDLDPVHDPALAAQRVIESAVELTRAEAGLALTRARLLVVELVRVHLAVVLAAAAAQVALVLIAVSPVLYRGNGWLGVLFALVPALVLTGVGARVAVMAWNDFRSVAKS
jgi:hypothetical protein